ncbi:MAG: Ig-like domain-containing protein [Burkholderiales bacterium]|nr:Ig-like domain-containing protein [Bacteroidia bacterium]
MQKLLIYICLILFGIRCAQITPLTGGKKDSTPPKALNYYPANISLNFNSKVIEVQFNEYIVIKDIANQFIITPQLKETPEIQANGKKLRIVFKEPLLPNTTYRLSFGNAITDLNETNVLQNFEYIFSTGPTIDSLKLTGQVLNSVDQKPASEILIGLYNMNANDSIIYKDKPLYITKSASDGNFIFNYLPGSLFKIVAIKDLNKNLVYDGSEEQVAFTNNFVNPRDSNFISLVLFKETPSKNFIKKSFSPEYGKVYVIYNKPQLDIKGVVAKGLIDYTQNRLKDTLTLYYANKYDTLETYVTYRSRKEDTLYIKVNSRNAFEKQIKNKEIKYSIRPDFNQSMHFYDLPGFEVNVPFDFKSLKEDRISLVEKTDSGSRKLPVTILKDKDRLTSFKVQSSFKPEISYVLTMNKGFIVNDEQRVNDSISFQFKTTTVDDYAQLKMKLFFPKKENYIILLLNDKEQIINERRVEFSLTSTSEKTIEYKNLIPGTYFFRIVEDANKNGLFDMGNYFLKQQSEIIFVNPTPVKLLAGWEIENEWIVK